MCLLSVISIGIGLEKQEVIDIGIGLKKSISCIPNHKYDAAYGRF